MRALQHGGAYLEISLHYRDSLGSCVIIMRSVALGVENVIGN